MFYLSTIIYRELNMSGFLVRLHYIYITTCYLYNIFDYIII